MGCPIPTILIGRRRDEHVLDISRSLHDVGVKSARDVPRDMAVKGPNAGIVLLPLEDLSINKRLGQWIYFGLSACISESMGERGREKS